MKRISNAIISIMMKKKRESINNVVVKVDEVTLIIDW